MINYDETLAPCHHCGNPTNWNNVQMWKYLMSWLWMKKNNIKSKVKHLHHCYQIFCGWKLWLVPAFRSRTGLRPSLMSAKTSKTFYSTFLFSGFSVTAAVVAAKISRHFNSLHPHSVSCVVKYARLSVGSLPGAKFVIRSRACRTFTLP